MILHQQYSFPLESSMNSYPLTPPSSSEDSPASGLLSASPNSNSYPEYEHYETMQEQPMLSINSTMVDLSNSKNKPFLRFIEQPTDRFRFRYKSEMAGTHGSLTGYHSDKSRKPTYPTVELKNFPVRAIIRCSIYQIDGIDKSGFYPHAHRLIMKKGKEEHDDPHDLSIGPEDNYRAVFQGMGIIHTAKKNLVSELTRKKIQLKKEQVARTECKMRELSTKELVEIKGLAESESKSINLNIVCLRFDAFIKENGILFPICDPIYSHGINNLKSALTGDLKIVRLDHVVSPASGNKEIFILVERVTKRNIKIRFYELDDEDRVVWQDWGRFNDLDVHHQYAIVFRTPKYRDEDILSPVRVYIELVRPTDGARSEPRDFRYIPNKNNYKTGQKRARYDYSYSYSSSTSNFGSDELPVPISTLQIGQPAQAQPVEFGPLNVPSGLSDEIKKAIDNIDSDEFKRIFVEHGESFMSLDLDAPAAAAHETSRRETIKLEVGSEERRMASFVIEQIRQFIRTKHESSLAVKMLKHYFNEDGKTNALHVAISQRDNDSAKLLLKVMIFYRQFDMLEKTNSDNQTPLHLAVLSFNKVIINSLLLCKARIRTTDGDLNTALHLAIKSNATIDIVEMLLINRECETVGEFIDAENDQGNTALVMAIDQKRLSFIKLLCRKGADINKIHPKNGYTPLRLAIEKGHADIVSYLLSLDSINIYIKDFQNVSPWEAAFDKDIEEGVSRAVRSYMSEHNIDVKVKEEPESDSEDGMEIDEDVEIKTELPQISQDELESMYKEVRELTPQCLDEVSGLLDRSENWKYLAELLEIEHLINSGIIHSDVSMSKAVLRYSIETNQDSIWIIRNFLENLDEFKAVEIIDRMVFESSKRS
ncbi:unnamed protein product [Phyllotreta striolata]|uniref:RHD domain-containing protein n=1 Tax=Phyllotreta striolata TaxID=444603 RepID=A0A9N9TS86_PHYSR|nr:unnamed protein product [Phyllotreta striolata]